MTERLYYTDPYLTEFDATILRLDRDGGRTLAVLDRTAFYPTSGGQPFDTGTLGSARVVDVIDGGDGSILHVVDGAVETGPVRGRIDWTRRFDHMQQHTGQHVLSAAFEAVAQARTESFHLGSASSTIDLAREVAPAQIEHAENEANRVVWEDRPVHVRFADAADAAAMPLRKESARSGTLRLIDVEGFDLSACGGTHVQRCGAIGVIAVAGWERFKGGTRVEFVCGRRALQAHRSLRDIVGAASRVLSVGAPEIGAAIERVQGEAKDARRLVKALQAQQAEHQAAALASRAEAENGVRLVVSALDGWDAGGLKTIASAIAERPGHMAVLLSSPPPSAIVVARASDVAVDCAALLRSVTQQFGGKGGGRPDLAQGGGLQGPVADMLDAARRLAKQTND